jgi:hypothetical protein
LKILNTRDHDGFPDYYTEPFEVIHTGGRFATRAEVLKSNDVLRHHLKETIIGDRFVSDEKTVDIEGGCT